MTLERTEFRRDPDAIAAWNRKTQDNTNKRARERKPTPGQRNSSLRLVSERKLTAIDGGKAPRPASRGRRPRPSFTPASDAQRAHVKDRPCLGCGGERGVTGVDPAHLVARAQGGCEDALCVVPLCRLCHDDFDGRTNGRIDLAPVLALPEFAAERAHMAMHMSFIPALQRLSGCRYAPVHGDPGAAA